MSLIKHKKVELPELFYDLVYAYVIAQITSLIHHPHQGLIPISALFSFVVGLLAFVNTWMVQTVFTNRFGSNSLTNIIFSFLQMMALLSASRAVAGDWKTHFTAIFLPFAILSFLLLLQYMVQYWQTTDEPSRVFIRPFFTILGLRSAGLFIAILFPYAIGVWIAVFSVVLTWLLPGIWSRKNQGKTHPINFPHLIERLSLLTILVFGEMILGISNYFSASHISLTSFFIFTIVASLFMIYIVEVDHLIDLNQVDMIGVRPIYSHYPIYVGLSLLTVSLTFLTNEEVSPLVAVTFFYFGLYLFLAGLFAHGRYHKPTHRWTPVVTGALFVLPALGAIVSLLALHHPLGLVFVAFLITLTLAVLLVGFNLKNNRVITN